jgi:hypothetical protein
MHSQSLTHSHMQAKKVNVHASHNLFERVRTAAEYVLNLFYTHPPEEEREKSTTAAVVVVERKQREKRI